MKGKGGICGKEWTCDVIAGRKGVLHYGYLLCVYRLLGNCDRERERESDS